MIFFVLLVGCNPVSASTITRFMFLGTLKGSASLFLTTFLTNYLKTGSAAFAPVSYLPKL